MRSMLLAATAAACLLTGAATAQSNVPIIPRDVLFGNPERAAGQISPDGMWLTWTAPVNGVMNVWLAPAANPGAAKPITSEKVRPIRQYFWAPDSKTVLYIQDKGGDENFLLYGVDVASGAEKLLTPFEKTRVQIVGISPLVPGRILVGVNNRDAKWHDVHSLDLATGKLTPVLMNMGDYAGFVADGNLVVRGALKSRTDGGSDYYRVIDNKVEGKPLEQVALDDSLTTNPLGFTTDGKTLYWTDSRGRNTAALIAQDVATGAKKVVAQDAKADIGDVLTNPSTGQVEAYTVDYLRQDWKPLGSAVAADVALLNKQFPGDWVVTSRTRADDKWVLAAVASDKPSTTYLYDRKSKSLTPLFESRPKLAGAPLVPMQPVVIKSRDGLDLVSYLTLPASSDANRDGKADRPAPLVLFVHGGPWARDSYGFNSYHQWLANRGYAVLSVNYRGSTGLGKDFTNAGNLQWGLKMHDDLLDAVNWAVKQGVTAPDKVAIMGGSYGGYATLAGMTFTPTTFACGVDIVGPSNLETLLKTIPPYWEAGKVQFYKRMGDPTSAEGLALLKAASPLYKADKIQRPLLIGQGANDPRVNQAESEQIVDAMRSRNIPVTYVLFPDEGHGFARPVNNIAFNAVTENFLAKCLGGRAEPIGDTIAKSTAKVPHGAEFSPGLSEALGGK
ncbi:S9 family peptidase [Sphingomonas humi]|uniref:S9 family peptidase n=1 Tax=Sphingomonas humi TaxID=335630 RepID=A0ABP7S6P6_9SPHN